jgi:rod shape determining protein RodA
VILTIRFLNFIEKIKKIDKLLLIITFLLSFYGLILIISASRSSELNIFVSQLIAIFVGISLMSLIEFLDYRKIAEHWKAIGIVCIILMAYTMFFGISIVGVSGVNARAWIRVMGNFTFQPSELIKIGFIITFAKHLENSHKSLIKNEPQTLAWLAAHLLVPVSLTHIQGDDGAAMIFILIALVMIFMAGADWKLLLGIFVAFLMVTPVLWQYALAPYQRNRILNQLNPESDPLNMGYQQIQGKLSIGSGGFFGKGLFKGDRSGNSMVPIQESDFIFSVAGEELGFVGCILILLLISALVWRSAKIAKKSIDSCGAYICFGFIGLVMAQTFLNLGMCLSLIPVVGVTLPFFSAGGSSVISLFIGLGILQNIHINGIENA